MLTFLISITLSPVSRSPHKALAALYLGLCPLNVVLFKEVN